MLDKNMNSLPGGHVSYGRTGWKIFPFTGEVQAGLLARASICAIALGSSVLLVIAAEWAARGTLSGVSEFLTSTSRPGLATIALLVILILAGDGALGGACRSLLVIGPAVVLLASLSAQKQLFLSDPLYPSDLWFARQVVELLPIMVEARPVAAVAIAIGFAAGLAVLSYVCVAGWRLFPRLSLRNRALRIALTLPLLWNFETFLQSTRYVWLKDRLSILPMMWDQSENYRHNGFLLAFAFNLPMVKVTAPAGYGPAAIADVPLPADVYATDRSAYPDVIMIMSESLWDPTRLPSTVFSADPMPTMRANQSGNLFSPEFGGMTSNVEFEALTGFSNAFLPQGSIPYQQYIRRPLPSLASFFRGEGYASVAVHPFEAWFWNRSNVYRELGFDKFWSQENLPEMEKQGMFVSDKPLFREIINKVDAAEQPTFLFAVTLQGHGPYEDGRYERLQTSITSMLSEDAAMAFGVYTEGVRLSDEALAELLEWAHRRERETIIVLFGDHLPPLGQAFQESGYMKGPVASRRAPLDVMRREHETPLMIWSSATGEVNHVGPVSPSLLPYHVVTAAGFRDPFYTGALAEVRRNYSVLDRYMLVSSNGEAKPRWLEGDQPLNNVLKDYWMLQYDMMFGSRLSQESFFPGFDWIQRSLPQPRTRDPAS